jgi:hypothetical protein
VEGIWGFRLDCEVIGGALVGIGGLIGFVLMALVHYGAEWILYRACQEIEKSYNR